MAKIVSNATVGGYYVEPAETFTLDNGDVLRVTQDVDSDSPLEWGHDVDAYVHRSGYSMSLPDCMGSADPIAYAFDQYCDRSDFGDPETALMRAMRYARVFHADKRVAKLVGLQGYSQGHWADILFVGPDLDTVNFIAETYAQYFRGDVWLVASDYDAMGGIYADSAEEAASIYVSEYYANGE